MAHAVATVASRPGRTKASVPTRADANLDGRTFNLSDLRVIAGPYLQDLLGQPQALEDTYEGLKRLPQLVHLAGRLGEFQQIVLTGMGSSFHALHPLNLQLIDHGIGSTMVETSELVHYHTRVLNPKTLVIAVSQSGESAEMVRLAKVNNGAPVIAVTNSPGSTLARHAAVATGYTGRAGVLGFLQDVCGDAHDAAMAGRRIVRAGNRTEPMENEGGRVGGCGLSGGLEEARGKCCRAVERDSGFVSGGPGNFAGGGRSGSLGDQRVRSFSCGRDEQRGVPAWSI